MFKTIFNIAKLATTHKLVLTRLPKPTATIQNKIHYNFTSTSNPSQVALMQQVEGKVFQVLRSAAKCDQKKLTKIATFQQLGFDSLDSVELVVAMEEYFGFDIPNQEAEKIQTVEAAINTFFRHLNSQVANKVVEQNQGDNSVQGKK